MPNALAVLAGVALVVAAVVWRERSRRRLQMRVAIGLASDDPGVRAVGLRVIGSGGLRRWSTVLLQRIDAGVDDQTASELAWLIVTNQWEPADDPKLRRLRQWAAGYLEHGRTVEAPAAPPPNPVLALDNRNISGYPAQERVDVPKPELVAAVEAALGGPVRWLRYLPTPAFGEAVEAKPALVVSVEEALGEPALWVRFVPAEEPQPAAKPALVATVEDVLATSVGWLRYVPAS